MSKPSDLLFRAALLVACGAASLIFVSGAAAGTQEDATSFAVTGGSLAFSTTPAMPTLSGVTLNGSPQQTNTQMTNFGVDDASGSGAGWNVTVNAASGTGKSAVFAAYCPNVSCGTDSGPGYVPSGASLPANSLVLNSTGASFTPAGNAPAHECNSGCNVDSASPVKLVSAAANNGMGTFTTTDWSAGSLTLITPANLKALLTGEVYRVDLLWSLTSGP